MEKKKCTHCKVNLPLEHFKVKRGGERGKNCNLCLQKAVEYRNKNTCEHGKQKLRCKECEGSQICDHGKYKYVCKECGGSQICEHGRIKQICKECGGSQICEHGRIKYSCKECNRNVICDHGKRKQVCKECGGNAICYHGIQKYRCKKCDGAGICYHGIEKYRCKRCDGAGICEHKKQKSVCNICDFEGYLAHIVSCQVRTALKTAKSQRSIKYLNCDIKTFKKHIEKQFEEGMTWENHDKSSPEIRRWEIDHITPIKYGNPTIEEVIERLHYTNTQPLWADENAAKGNRYKGKSKN
uniref:Uncharacterized protein n=1 Tax=Marseillevirus LCMAC101 TaxID=2506602 RepID=A0A481YSM3_9VIRU|nr:MAG: hypothetical protein LCMAC101_05750 [Marseillevirus LCMAC101]